MKAINYIRYLKKRLRFALHNSKSTRQLLKNEVLTQKEFEQLFQRMTHLECVQMQLQLIKRNQKLVNQMVHDFEQKYANIEIPKEFNSNRLLYIILQKTNRK